MTRCWMPQFPHLYKDRSVISTLWQTQQALCWRRKDLTPFREALLIYTSNQSLKGQCPHLAVPPWSQIEGMWSDVYIRQSLSSFFHLYHFTEIYVADCHCWAPGAWISQKGEWSLGCDLQVLLRLFRFWMHIKQGVKYVYLGCEKLGQDQITVSLQQMEKSIYLSQ